MILADRLSGYNRPVRISHEEGPLSRFLKDEVDEPAKAFGMMFQIIDIQLPVGLSAKKRKAIFPGDCPSERK